MDRHGYNVIDGERLRMNTVPSTCLPAPTQA